MGNVTPSSLAWSGLQPCGVPEAGPTAHSCMLALALPCFLFLLLPGSACSNKEKPRAGPMFFLLGTQAEAANLNRPHPCFMPPVPILSLNPRAMLEVARHPCCGSAHAPTLCPPSISWHPLPCHTSEPFPSLRPSLAGRLLFLHK
jgi:hypothetical protein